MEISKQNYLIHLNKKQKEAIMDLDGPCLIVAGAGSGKTRVLTSRVAHIISEKKAWPNQILCVTFTNKAAREMQNRIANFLNENSNFYKGYISRFSFKYQFNNSLNIRLISEYNDFYKQFFIQPLIQWNPNPSTIFYIGGNQGSIEDFNSEFSSPYRIDRTQYFLKFQYLIGL